MKGESLHTAAQGLDAAGLTTAFAAALGRKPGALKPDEAAFINGATMTVNGAQYIAG
jgi:hypothetical protein